MNDWIPLLATVVGALLTAVVGNRLVQFWQHRNWRNQQQFSGLEKEYTALKALSDTILKDCGSRLASMRELNSAALRGNWNDELIAYKVVLRDWNKAFHASYAQLIFQLEWKFADELDRHVHKEFVDAGKTLEQEIRSQKSGNAPSRQSFVLAESNLNNVAGVIANFGRSLVRETELRRQEVFYGRKLSYKKSDIVFLSNFDLIKLLFHPDVDRFAIIRPTSNISSPLGRRV